jgi:hypothetical protein
VRGRNGNNKPRYRKEDVYSLLLRLGGEARWKDLESAVGHELKWGPTTLKKTLDCMINEGLVLKEARVGEKGPEVWYKVRIKGSDIFNRITKAASEGNDVALHTLIENAKECMRTLKGKEKELFIKEHLKHVVKLAQDEYTSLFLFFLLKAREFSGESLMANFDMIFNTSFQDDTEALLKIFLHYPQYSAEVIRAMLNEPSFTPSVA